MLGMGLINDGSWIMFFLPSAQKEEKEKRSYHPTNCIQSGMIATPIN